MKTISSAVVGLSDTIADSPKTVNTFLERLLNWDEDSCCHSVFSLQFRRLEDSSELDNRLLVPSLCNDKSTELSLEVIMWEALFANESN